jgi:integrase
MPFPSPGLHQSTCASLLIARGASLVYARDQLGHRSIQITADTYGQLLVQGNQAAINQFDDPTIRNPYATTPLQLLRGGQP